ncbi:Type 1 glutamine amidotransferase-like domain-containing protein [Nocardia asteroides]|uniref:Type 1 glutamine amidotransferase-like domain-containing protein n=1 Tax=Nocardia asteroides TaxID=1824 RepID=UPI001E5BB76F|nr:Type 1 glutamine amidotransferase-like domain-containing protein [Nocardia asteroides]UGT53703.1 Type 1 glutamine amidotransferase-like domain-containing protein [Nocardia asteroides]
MRLFLASYRFGAFADRFDALVGPAARIAVIPNACDAWPAAWSAAVTSDVTPLRQRGYAPEVVDLRDYAGQPAQLERRLREFGAVWVRGGNTFVLRAQFARSGADSVLPALLRADALAYAGYSAGACLLAPSLRGLETMDDPAEVLPATGVEPRWDGLGLVDHRFVVHLDSATDPDGEAPRLLARYRDEGVAHWALTDDDVVVIADGRTEVLRGGSPVDGDRIH